MSRERVVEFRALWKHSDRAKEEVEDVLPRARSLTPVTTEQKRKSQKKKRKTE